MSERASIAALVRVDGIHAHTRKAATASFLVCVDMIRGEVVEHVEQKAIALVLSKYDIVGIIEQRWDVDLSTGSIVNVIECKIIESEKK